MGHYSVQLSACDYACVMAWLLGMHKALELFGEAVREAHEEMKACNVCGRQWLDVRVLDLRGSVMCGMRHVLHCHEKGRQGV